MSTFFLVAGLSGGLAGQDAGQPPADPPAPALAAPGSLEALLPELRKACPDRDAAAARGQEFADRIIQTIEESRSASTGEDAPGNRAGEGPARFLAVELYRLAGADRQARTELAEIVAVGPADEDRAKALYLLGEEYFLREAYVPRTSRTGRMRPSAYAYWIQLAERFPGSPWARDVERPLRYLRLLRGAPVPPFAGRFEAGGRAVELSPEALKGRILLVSFWRSSSPGEREFQAELETRLASFARKGGAPPIEAVGVNLDLERAAFAKAIEEWGIRRPQVHDGKGFATPLAEAFGIPRAPHWLLLDTDGKIAYLGADPTACLTGLSRLAARP